MCQKLVEIESKDEQQFTIIVGAGAFRWGSKRPPRCQPAAPPASGRGGSAGVLTRRRGVALAPAGIAGLALILVIAGILTDPIQTTANGAKIF